jgi:Zn-dependent protease
LLDQDTIALFPLWYVAFLLSLTCHEAAHALVAKWGGDPTAYYSGQVTLNPLPHVQREMFGTIAVPAITFLLNGWMLGWGSAPYDPYWEQRHPRRASWMALAGPVANFILVAVAAVAIHAGLAAGIFRPLESIAFSHVVSGTSDLADGFARFASLMFSLNLLLGCFNLLPVAPLDGHSVVGLLLPEDTYIRWLEFIRQPMPSLIGLVAAWQFFGHLFMPVYYGAITLLYWGVRLH